MANGTEPERTKLMVENPDMMRRDAPMTIEMPTVIDEASYILLKKQLEFRRRCCNQQWDNLFELLELHWQCVKDRAAEPETT